MKGMTEFIQEHERRLEAAEFGPAFLDFHLRQIRFLQHERLVHLLVMLFVLFAFLFFFLLYLLYGNLYMLALFSICLVLSVFYIFHYFKLENTVIRWYFIYNDNSLKEKIPPPRH